MASFGREQRLAVQLRWKGDGGDGGGGGGGFFKIFLEKLKKNIEQSPELGSGIKSITEATEKPREAAKKAADYAKSTTSLSSNMFVTGLSSGTYPLSLSLSLSLGLPPPALPSLCLRPSSLCRCVDAILCLSGSLCLPSVCK